MNWRIKMIRSELVSLNNFDAVLSDGFIIQQDNGNSILKLKDTRPNGSLFYADFTRSLNDLWNKTGGLYTTLGVVDISSGLLDLSYNDVRGINYILQANTNIKTGSIIFEYTPNYVYSGFYTPEPKEVGDPDEIDRDIVIYSDGSGNTPSCKITHKQDNNLFIEFYTDGGKIAAFSYIFLNEYNRKYIIEVTYDFNIALGEECVNLYINGVKIITNQLEHGQKLIAKDYRATFDNFWIGNDYTKTRYSNFKMGYVAIFNAVLHNAAYIVPVVLPDKIYSIHPQYCDIQGYFGVKKLVEIYNSVLLASNSEIRLVIGIKTDSGIDYKYFDIINKCWKISNSTLLQANLFSELTVEALEMLILKDSEICFRLIGISNNGYDTPMFYSFYLDYIFFYKKTVEIHKTLVYINFEGVSKSKCKIRAVLNSNTIYKDIYELTPEIYESVSDEYGYAEIYVPDTDNMDETNYYIFTLYNNDTLYKTINLKVPEVQNIEFHQLSFS